MRIFGQCSIFYLLEEPCSAARGREAIRFDAVFSAQVEVKLVNSTIAKVFVEYRNFTLNLSLQTLRAHFRFTTMLVQTICSSKINLDD